MPTKSSILFLILILPLQLLGQKALTQAQVQADYSILKKVLTQGHPGLYEYTSAAAWDSLFADFATNQLPAIHNVQDFYNSITALTDQVRDGHLVVMRPPLDTIPPLFPVLLKIIDGKLYTDTDDFGIPLGSEIRSIDGVPGPALRDRFFKYAPADGYNTTKKDRQIEREFGILHFYEFGAQPVYQVKYKTPAGKEGTTQVTSQPFTQIGQRFANRASYFGKNTQGQEAPFVYFIDSLQTAVLTINTFGMDVPAYQASLKECFKTIKRNKVEHLIIDVRQTEGGYPVNAIHTFSYLAKEPFKQRLSSEVVTSVLPEKQYAQNLVNGYTYESFFAQFYSQAAAKDGRWVSQVDENEHLMVPHKKGYDGQVYVLIGGRTFSAGSSFALFCKNVGIPLFGEEAGGGYYTQTGGYPVLYTLPHSKLKILIPLVKINRYVSDPSVPAGSGVPPDREIQVKVHDLIDRKDGQLEAILEEIKSMFGN